MLPQAVIALNVTSSAVAGAIVGIGNGGLDTATGAARGHAVSMDVPDVAVELVLAFESILAVVLATNFGARISRWILTMDTESVSYQVAPGRGFVFATVTVRFTVVAIFVFVMRSLMSEQRGIIIIRSYVASFPNGPLNNVP